jgi:hypothetical protein
VTANLAAILPAILPVQNSAESCKENNEEEKHEEDKTEITLMSMHYFEANKCQASLALIQRSLSRGSDKPLSTRLTRVSFFAN